MNQARTRAQAVVTLGCVLAWGLLALCPGVFALDPSLDISQYAHTPWKIRDGFTKGLTRSIAQTSDGYLWLGTESGLYRFDGVRAIPWQPPAGSHLPSDFIRHLLGARDGTLWISTQAGLASWKDGKLTNLPEFQGRVTGQLLQDRQGTVWVSVFGPGEICSIASGKAQCYGRGDLGQGVYALHEDSNGYLWLTAATGLWRWAPGSPEHYAYPAGVNISTALAEDEHGVLLLGSPKGLMRLVSGKIESYVIPGVNRDSSAEPFQSGDGSLWISSHQGLLHFYRGKLDRFSAVDGLSGDYALSFFEDREGSVWISTSEGIDRFRELAIPRISAAQGLLNTTVTSVQAADDGSIWIGTTTGLSHLEGSQITNYRSETKITPGSADVKQPQPTSAKVREVASSGLAGSIGGLALDDRGQLWGSDGKGVFYLSGKRFIRVPGTPVEFSDAIAGDGQGNVWVLNGHEGLFEVVAGGSVQKVSTVKPISSLQTYWGVLLADRSGSDLWIGSRDGGIQILKDRQVSLTYTAKDGLGAGRVSHLRFGTRGALWVATQSGLSRIKDGQIATLTSKNGLPCDDVVWSIEDEDHAVWVYMSCGLARIERAELDAWVANTKHVATTTVFDISDGVRSMTFAGFVAPPVTKSRDGKIWFKAYDGVSFIDPHHLAFNKLPPPVHIEQIIADRKTYDATQGLSLPPLVHDLQIDFTALSLVAPEKVRFRYKLEGYDKDWQEAGNRRQAFYTNLPPRPYRFRVMACNNSGVWNEEGDFLEFSIAPAFYERTSFRVLCVLALLVLLFCAYRLRVRQLALQFNRTLEARVSERTRIARDLHDTLLQSYQALLLRFQSASKLLPDRPVEAKTRLDNAIDQAAAAITEGRDAVQGLRSSAFETNDLANAITAIAEELTSAASPGDSPAIEVEVEGTSRNLNPVVRDETYRIATEALRNAFRHSDARRIVVEIVYERRQFHLRVRDDGKGFEGATIQQQRTGHFGLPGMRERAEIVGGRLEVWSAPGSGTRLHLSIPGSVAYRGSRSAAATAGI